MATETILYQNDIIANSNDFTATTKKSQESDCHRQKQKKKNKASDEESDDCKNFVVNFLQLELVEQIEIEYVLEKAELVKGMDEEFRKIFDKFTFTDAIALEDTNKKDGLEENAATNKKVDLDSKEEENDNEQKEKDGRRGIEKPPFQLPDFIAATGIKKISQKKFVVIPFFVNGYLHHHDNVGSSDSDQPKEQVNARKKFLKGLGCNKFVYGTKCGSVSNQHQ
ncbi:hypothetical protein JHK87_047543 [Glycine soja]|nr:hypothetical protein JHK87_047543 [Glycine soja]